MKLFESLDFKNIVGLGNSKYTPEPDARILPPTQAIPAEGSRGSFKKETILEWTGLSKIPSSAKNEKFMWSVTILSFVVLVLLLILQEFIIIIAVLVVIFISYVISATPTEQVKYSVTNLGLEYAGDFHPWDSFRYFFLLNKGDYVLFNLDLKSEGLSRLFVFTPAESAGQVKDALNQFLPFLEKPPEDFADKLYRNFLNKFLVNK